MVQFLEIVSASLLPVLLEITIQNLRNHSVSSLYVQQTICNKYKIFKIPFAMESALLSENIGYFLSHKMSRKYA